MGTHKGYPDGMVDALRLFGAHGAPGVEGALGRRVRRGIDGRDGAKATRTPRQAATGRRAHPPLLECERARGQTWR